MRLLTITATAAVTLILSACGSPAEDKPADTTAAPSAAATVADAGGKPASFVQCASCHSVEPGKHGVGPSLAGVHGQKAGAVAGYSYTPANKNSGLTWDDNTLDTYLTNPMKMVPGTKMSFAGMGDPAKRKEVIDYMKTLK